MLKTKPPKILDKWVEKLRISSTNGTVIQKVYSLFILRALILKKNVVERPCEYAT